jgi:hypothetical protein
MNLVEWIEQVPIWPNENSSYLESGIGVLGFAVYGIILAYTLMHVADSLDNGARGYSDLLLFTIFILYIGITIFFNQILEHNLWSSLLGILIIAAIYPSLLYIDLTQGIGGMGYQCSECDVNPLIFSVLLQDVMLITVYSILTRPIVPDAIENPETLELHLTNWWRITQAIMSISIALGIGLFAQFLFDSSNVYIVEVLPLIAGLGMGLLIILGCILYKNRVAENVYDRQISSGN